MVFDDRADGGKELAKRLSKYANRPDAIVLALPRGGVPVAYEVAQTLHLPLDVFLVRKLGVPGHEELAFGAVASGGMRVINRAVVRSADVSAAEIEETIKTEQRELERREQTYRDERPTPQIEGRTVILVDDGLATGASMRAAVLALREQKPAKIVVAVPTAARETCDEFRDEVDEVVCAMTPEPFYAVGLWYRDFSQTSDEEVRDLLSRASQTQEAANKT
jgi:putative phosphoribosyl transferase